VRFSKPILLIGLILLSGPPLMGQRHFYLEDRSNFKAKIPRDVSNLLLQEIKRRHLCRLNGLSDISPLFSAAHIDLGPASGLILASDQGCLNGADNDRFWASMGLSWKVAPFMRFDLAYTHLWVKDPNVNITAASGNPSFSASSGPYVGTVSAHSDLFSASAVIRFDDLEPSVKKPFMK